MNSIDRIIQSWRIKKASQFIKNGDKILDIGCGEGELFEYLGDRIGNSIGIDPTLPETIKRGNYRLIQGVFPKDVPANDYFDVITLLAVVEHLSSDILLRMNDIFSHLLKKAGTLIFTIPSKHADLILSFLRHISFIEADTLDEHSGFDPAMIFDIIKEKDFTLYHKETFELTLNNLFVFKKK